MDDISEKDKQLAQAMCNAYAKKLKTRTPKTGETADTGNLTFSGQATFSDTGNDNADFDFADFNKKAKAEVALNEIRTHTIAESIKAGLTRYIERRNAQILRSKKLAAQRFGFKEYEYKDN